jgi:hypothetical protein
MLLVNRFFVSGLALFLFACSESKSSGGGGEGGSTDGGGAAGATGAGNEGGAGAGNETGGMGSGAGNTGGAGAGPSGAVVVNEIDANGDWIELFNTSGEAFDLSGLLLADYDDVAMGPKLDEAIEFPAGTSIDGGAHLFILAKIDTVMPGVAMEQTMCAPGTSPCFFAPFGLSDGDGDTVYLLDGETVLASGEYPPAAALEGESWCRFPDGSGAFAVCTGTPGTTNAQ